MQSSDFEKHFVFMFPRMVNVENPHHFWIRAFPEELENVEKLHNLRIQAFPEELSQGISQNVEWNSLQLENIRFDVELTFLKEAYFQCSQDGNDENPVHFRIRSAPEELAQAYLKTWVELNSARKHNF
ncbi:hypothetical protein E2320_022950 [Naja naja]|nr:hypothetical protein E2320_022950 [Naja naja]